MLSLKLGETFVDTKNADIPVVLRNPLFVTDEGKIPGSFIFNFSVPLTEELKRELSFAHRPARKGKPTWRLPFALRFGILHYTGTANITEINGNDVEVSMPVDVGSLSTLLRDKTLKDLDINDVVEYAPKITYALLNKVIDYGHSQFSEFTHDLQIIPGLNQIDTFQSYNPDTGILTIPEAGNYNLSIAVNAEIGYDPQPGEYLGKNMKLVIKKNDVDFTVVNIENNHHNYANTILLNKDDQLSFFVRATSRQWGGAAHILIYAINLGTALSVYFIESSPFANIITQTWPDVNYAVFPLRNPKALENIPSSIFRVDFDDIKEYSEQFNPIVNYYTDNHFPLIVQGAVNSFAYILLNLFSPAPYIAYIVKKILSFVGYSPVNNVFESDELKRLVYQSNWIINNYFFDSQPIKFIDFLPNEKLSDFLRGICKQFGIVFKVDNTSNIIRFAFIDDIISDTSSIEFSKNVVSNPSLKSENIEGFTFSIERFNCQYIANHYIPTDNLNFIGSVDHPGLLPETADINDCYYVSGWKYYSIWNYNPDEGVYGWLFYSINFNPKISDQEYSNNIEDKNILDIALEKSTPAMYFFDPDITKQSPVIPPGWDNTIGTTPYRIWLIPAFFVPANFTQLPEQYKSDSIATLLFYHGMQNDINNAEYPFASNDVFDLNDNKISHASLSLRPDGTYGLYEKRWKNFIQWRLSSPGEYTIEKHLTPLEISNLDWFKWHKILGVDYMIKEIRFNIRNDHITVAEIVAYRR